jgi:tRNA pseudouridine55 synthase
VPLSGIINIDKPPAMTSHDVVDAVRRVSGQRKVGHAGTLDPMASGVLLVCLGQATRVAEYLMAGRKQYRAALLVGQTTTTYDVEGEILTSGGRTDFSQAQIEAALARFRGTIEQVPPMYSALKHEGQPLYKLARRGQEVERPVRRVEIDRLTLLSWSPPSLIVEVVCSPGTYIRSLAHDLGQHLGSGAVLASLVRLASGRFTLSDAVSLERLEEAFEHGQEAEYLQPVDQALLDLPAVILSAESARRLAQGQAVPAGGAAEAAPSDGNGAEARVYSAGGDLIAIARYDAAARGWLPHKVFAQ